jgi:two-component system aerobic respiration control sensor histidine kinase ArcB
MFNQFKIFLTLIEDSVLIFSIISVLVVTTSLIVLYYKNKYSSLVRKEFSRHHREEKTLRERLNSIDSLLNSYPDPFVFKNSKGVYTWCNKALEKLWGMPKNRIIGSTPENLFPNESDEIRKMENMVNTRVRPLIKERKFTDKEGDTKTYEVSFLQMKDPETGKMGVLIHFKDISHYRDQLDILNDLYVSVKEDLQLRSDYYADFLRTGLPPLNQIIEDSDSLLHNDSNRVETRKKLERITSSGQEMNSTIRNLSFLAFPDKISALYEGNQEQPRNETRSLEDWQNQLVNRVRQFYQQQGFPFFVLLLGDVPESLNTRFTLLNELLERLIDNAEGLSHGGMYIIIKVHRVESLFFTMNITVRNLGPAIDAARREDIFKPFTRIILDRKGPGLGLTVARSLAEKMGGSLSCDPSCSDGARFLLSIPPVKGEGTVISGYRLGGGPGKEPGAILIADDDSLFRKKLSSQLEQIGYSVDQTETGQEAVLKMKENDYFLVLVNDHLLTLSGLEILKQWKNGAFPRVNHCSLLTSSLISEKKDSNEYHLYRDAFEKPLNWDLFLDLLIKKQNSN